MKPETIRDFQAAKFGMFLHWGLYAVPGGRWNGESMDYIGEWIQSKFRIPNAEYARLAREFNPDRFDADTSPHNHFICRKCHAVLDMDMEDISEIKERAEQNFHGIASDLILRLANCGQRNGKKRIEVQFIETDN